MHLRFDGLTFYFEMDGGLYVAKFRESEMHGVDLRNLEGWGSTQGQAFGELLKSLYVKAELFLYANRTKSKGNRI